MSKQVKAKKSRKAKAKIKATTPPEKQLNQLYSFNELPLYLKDNDFILRHYRMNYTQKECWISLFRLHNELGNVWTHLLSFIIFSIFIIDLLFLDGIALEYIYPAFKFQSLDRNDVMIFAIFLSGGMIAFICSSIFHLHFCHHNKSIYVSLSCVDYSGISALIFTSACSFTYYMFYCNSGPRDFWLILLGVVNLVGFVGPYTPYWAGPDFRLIRTVSYISSGTFIFLPITHYALLNGHHHEGFTEESLILPNELFALYGLFLSVLVYLFGCVFYVGRIPERFSPGLFDIFGHSHQWWHGTVFLGAMVHLRALIAWQEWRSQGGGKCN